MDKILFTQRVEIVESYGERRDCADQNIVRFLLACEYLPVPVPNVKEVVEQIFLSVKPAGVVLTGGNSLVKYGGNAPERDETERGLLQLAIDSKVPVYGFCRGMQVVLDYFGCELEEVKDHVAVRHKIAGKLNTLEVNSFHSQACRYIKEPLEMLAQAEDGVIEAICHREKRILGTMWHPERENPFIDTDIQRVQKLFG